MSTPVSEHIVELEVRFDAPPAEVFRYFVEPDRYVRWQGVRAQLDPRPGGIYRVTMDAANIARGEYVELDPPHRVVFTWGWEGNAAIPPGTTTVEVTLRPDGDGTIVALRHTGLPGASAAATHDEGWVFFTERLRSLLLGKDPGPMPERMG